MSVDNQLLFLNFSNPGQEARQNAFRKQVRSFVTTKQHRRTRHARSEKTDAKTTRPRTPRTLEDILSEIEQCGESDEVIGSAWPTPTAADSQLVAISRPVSNQEHSHWQSRDEENETERPRKHRRSEAQPKDAASVVYFAESPLHHLCMEDPTDDLNASCKQLGQSMSDSLHLLSNLVDALGPDLEQKLNIQRGLTAKYMLPMVLKNPALLAATTLKCATMICRLKGEYHQRRALLELRQHALARIREALEDESGGATADELLCAVSTLANYELVHNGNRELYHAHKMGLVKMIALRGGLQALGNEGYTQSTLLYNDVNTAKLAGCLPHLRVFRQVTTDVDPEFWLQGVGVHSTPESEDSFGFDEEAVE